MLIKVLYHPSIFLQRSRGNHNKPQIRTACLLAKIQAWHHSQYRVIIVCIHSFTLLMLYTMPTHHITTTLLIADCNYSMKSPTVPMQTPLQ